MTPDDLLAAARELLRRRDPVTAGLWPRASALLGRQALEAALQDLWRRKDLDLARCTTRAQLLCLLAYLPDPAVGRRAAHAWAALSRACHHRGYEGAPTAPELAAWLEAVGDLVAASGPPVGGGGQDPSRS
jgi:hypothetical protein